MAESLFSFLHKCSCQHIERRFRPSWVSITLNVQYKVPHEQALSPSQNLLSEGSSLESLGSCPPAPSTTETAGILCPGHTPRGVGATHRAWGSQGRRAGSGQVGSAHRLSLAARLHQSLTGNEEKTAWAAWKSPPGPTPECDSGGLAFKLPSHPQPGPRGPCFRKQHSLSAQTKTQKS